MKKFITFVFLFTLAQWSQAQDFDAPVTVGADQPQKLVSLIEDAMSGTGSNHIKIVPGANGETQMLITDDYMGSSTAFPEISKPLKISANESDNIRIVLSTNTSKSNKSNHQNYNAFYVFANAVLYLQYIAFENFVSNGNGGVISAADNALVYLSGVTFLNNFSFFEGGAVFLLGNSRLFAMRSRFEGNQSSGVGGAVSIRGAAFAFVILSTMINNVATPFGCDFNVESSPTAGLFALFLFNNIFISNCSNVMIENPIGMILFLMNSVFASGNMIDSTGLFLMYANAIKRDLGIKSDNTESEKALCNDFGTNAISSLGYNISNEASCNLNKATDMPNTDPMMNPPDANGMVTLQAGSPAIDGGASSMQSDTQGGIFLPCAYKDSRGLGRPQDANGDGIFECDIGSYEVRNGDDITNAQTGLFFDTDRNGEGILVEMLSATQVLITFYTYNPNKQDLMWFIGLGTVVGNTLVIDDVFTTSGGVFGSGFDASAIVNQKVGSMSLIFPDCEANGNPGRLVFQADRGTGVDLEDLLVKSSRLTRVLNCSQTQTSSKAGRSGAFYDPSRSGEGLFIQVLSDSNAVVIFYTYTPAGKQFWMFSSNVQINGDTITANMIYPSTTTGFGTGFNGSELVFSDWGTVTIKHLPGCNDIMVNYSSVVSGFGTGQYNYKRLTQPAGTTCDL
jgi:hypothetical protein